MIETRHRRWAIALYDGYIRRLLKKSFHALHLFGTVPDIPPDRPLIILPNHNSWWDGFLVDAFNKHAYRRKIYLMMLEEQLRKYRFFASIGAYGIVPGNSSEVRKGLRYTADIMEQEGGNAAISIFPQGELLPFGVERAFHSGYELAARLYGKPVTLLPLAMRIEMKREQRPEVFYLAGKPVACDALSVLLARDLEYLHAELQEELIQSIRSDAPSTMMFRGRHSAHTQFDTVRRNA